MSIPLSSYALVCKENSYAQTIFFLQQLKCAGSPLDFALNGLTLILYVHEVLSVSLQRLPIHKYTTHIGHIVLDVMGHGFL